jgi:TP901 family phage tail tape measure protein
VADFTIAWDLKTLDSFSKNLDKLEKRFDEVDDNLEKIGKSSEKNSKRFGNAFKNMAGAVLSFASLKQFVTIGTNFQDSLADLSAITGAVGDDLDFLSDQAFVMGKQFATSGAEVAEAFKLVGSKKAELLSNLPALTAVTEQVLLLKNAAGIELKDAAITVTQALNIFGKGADSASEFVNTLAASSKLGASEVARISEALEISGPVAAKAGLSFQQLNGLIQALAKGGLEGARAGTGIQAVLQRLSSEGIDFNKIGLTKTFELLGKQIEKTTDVKARAELIEKLFGKEHAKTGLTLIENAKLIDDITKGVTGSSVASEQAAIRLATFSAKIRQLGTIIEEKLVKTFIRLEPQITLMAENFGKWLDTLDEDKINGFADGMKGILDVVTMLGKGLAFIANILDVIGTGIGETAAKIVQNPAFLLAPGAAAGSLAFDDNSTLGSKVSNLFGFGGEDTKGIEQGQTQNAKADVTVKIEAPAGVVAEADVKTQGSVSLDTGANF